MRELLLAYPGAQRALFRQFHIGGCSACGFSPDETLEQICARSVNLPVDHVVAFLESAQAEDRKMMIEPEELRDELAAGSAHLLDIRTAEEFEAVHIPGAVRFTQERMNDILMEWPREEGVIALIDHKGQRALDAAAYFSGHGFKNVRALAGGIDAYAERVAPELPRYELE